MATCMLVFFAFAFGVLLTIFVSLARNAGKKDDLEELTKDVRPSGGRGRTHRSSPRKKPRQDQQRESWERDADWWRKN